MITKTEKAGLLTMNGNTFRCICGFYVVRRVIDDERPDIFLYECCGCGIRYTLETSDEDLYSLFR